MKRFTALWSALVLALGLAAFTGTALAGNGNGNGAANGNGNAAATPAAAPTDPAAAPGNSGNAPGQAKKDAPAAPAAPAAAKPAPAAKPAKAPAPAKAKPTVKSSTAGVKPSNPPSHGTTAPASSNKTKLYGNGQTAGQIATKNGHGDATLIGPGNSQPHKIVTCGHPHGIDVHALKSNAAAKSCATSAPATAAAATPTVTPVCGQSVVTTAGGVMHATGSKTNPYVVIHPNANSAHLTGKHPDDRILPATQTLVPNGATCSSASASASASAPAATGGTAPASASSQPGAAGSQSAGGVLGAQASIRSASGKPAAKSKPAGGVLGAFATLGQGAVRGTLPFTGFPLWIALAIAAVLLVGGIALRRGGRTNTNAL